MASPNAGCNHAASLCPPRNSQNHFGSGATAKFLSAWAKPTISSSRLCMTRTGTFTRGSFVWVSYFMRVSRRTGNQGNNSAPMSEMLVKVP